MEEWNVYLLQYISKERTISRIYIGDDLLLDLFPDWFPEQVREHINSHKKVPHLLNWQIVLRKKCWIDGVSAS